MDDLALLDDNLSSSATEPAVPTPSDAAGASPDPDATPTPGAEEPSPAAEAAAEEAAEPEAEPEDLDIPYPEDEPEALDEESPAVAAAAAETEPTGPAARFGTASLTKLLKDNPPLAQAIEAQPRLKSQLYQMARRSQELGQYQELVPSLTRAREAVQAASQLQELDQAYYGDDPRQFWSRLYAAQMRPDPATGQPRSSGAYERQVQFLHQAFLDRMEQQALREKNTELSGAVRSFRDALGWNPAQSSPAPEGTGRPTAAGVAADASPDARSLPLHIRQKLEQAERNTRELEELRLRRNEDVRRQGETFLSETAAEVASELRGFVDGLLGNAKLSDYDKRNIARDFIESASHLANQDKVHAAALEEILRSGGNTPQTRAKMVARAKAWARQNGRDILEPILTRAGAGLKQRQAQRQALQARQHSEPSAAGLPANPKPPTARDLVRTAESKLGRRLTDREILEMA